jgi:deoxycytidylate deaminase
VSPAAIKQRESSVNFVTSNYADNPSASRAFVAEWSRMARERLANAATGQQLRMAHASADSALAAAQALAELELGAAS